MLEKLEAIFAKIGKQFGTPKWTTEALLGAVAVGFLLGMLV